MPTNITLSGQNPVVIQDDASGVILRELTVPNPPGSVSGLSTGVYGAGLGAAIDWRTSTVIGRRITRGRTFVVPLAQAAYSATGSIIAGVQTNIQTAAGLYLQDLTTGGLHAVVWHRPPKGASVGGALAVVTAYLVPSTPAGLRSRRT
jgi:hypothetical protein